MLFIKYVVFESPNTHVAVLLLNKLEERRHVRPAKVVDGFEAGEHAPPLQSLEMILANVLEEKEREISVS